MFRIQSLAPARRSVLLLALAAGSTCQAFSQSADAPASPTIATSATVQPALNELSAALQQLRIAKWKAPGQVKDDAQANAASIQRDMTDTLPGLLSDADAMPHSAARAFAAYRNVDALYDVVLRVSESAYLAAPESEAQTLDHALSTLEAARKSLGDAIMNASQAQEASLARIVVVTRAAPPPPAATKVVDDSDKPAPAVKKKKKPAPKPAAPPPAPQN